MSGENPFKCKYCGGELYISMVFSKEGLAPLVICPECDQIKIEEAITPDEPGSDMGEAAPE